MPDDLLNQIDTTAQNPRRVRTDAGEVESQNLRDMIEADKYLSGKDSVSQSATRTRRGLRFNRLIPPGTT
jgi:hypothetical protein